MDCFFRRPVLPAIPEWWSSFPISRTRKYLASSTGSPKPLPLIKVKPPRANSPIFSYLKKLRPPLAWVRFMGPKITSFDVFYSPLPVSFPGSPNIKEETCQNAHGDDDEYDQEVGCAWFQDNSVKEEFEDDDPLISLRPKRKPLKRKLKKSTDPLPPSP